MDGPALAAEPASPMRALNMGISPRSSDKTSLRVSFSTTAAGRPGALSELDIFRLHSTIHVTRQFDGDDDPQFTQQSDDDDDPHFPQQFDDDDDDNDDSLLLSH